MHAGTQATGAVDTRWVPTLEEVADKKTAEARLAAKGYQRPDLRDGIVDIAGRVCRKSSHLQLICMSALKIWKMRRADITNARLHANGTP